MRLKSSPERPCPIPEMRVSGHRNGGNVRTLGADGLKELQAVHAWQPEVSHEKVGRTIVMFTPCVGRGS